MGITTDFHTHVLPGIDDGSQSVEESIAMLRAISRQGFGRVVATPHFYAQEDKPQRFLERRAHAEALLRQEMELCVDLPEVVIGTEVYYFRGMADSDALQALTIGNSRYILVEMPNAPWPEHVWQELAHIQIQQGLAPIIAHIDRYIGPWKQYGIPQQLEALPIPVQANASFFLRSGTRRMALRMLKNGQIHLLGSDCHNMTSRPPNLKEAVALIEKQLGQGVTGQIRDWEDRILTDTFDREV